MTTLTTTHTQPTYPIQELYQRLKNAGFDPSFVRRYVLPDWWDDELSSNPATRAMAEVYISRMIGIPVQHLRTPGTPLKSSQNIEYRLKRNKNVPVDELLPAIMLAQALGSTFARALGNLPKFQAGDKAIDIRKEILKNHDSVDLAGLLNWAWKHGIIVVHLHKLPLGTKKFSGIAMICDERPVIVLAGGQDSPPWLAFHVAHELGHILLGHVEPGQPLLDDNIDQRLKIYESMQDPNFDQHEAEANDFALLLLTSRPDLKFEAEYGLTADKLVARVRSIGQVNDINAGTLALVYGHTASRMGVAQNALKELGLDQGAHRLIADTVKRYLPEDVPEALAAFLPLINCEQ